MKKLLLVLVCLQLANAMNRAELDDKVKELIQIRTTIESSEISSVNNPFYQDKDQEQDTITFSLFAIVDKRAKINQKWCGIGEEISNGYKVVSVNKEKVGISNSNNYIELNLKDMKNVKIKVK
ncbi:hypothetical protein [Campylobacter sp. MG1]|uniref:hypothetical protein n=1 Tax=Campylobacter sp. MG1 TaxID=2976332 RepID=UPI00226D3255|nr:hypothetical protein [Campylobacter sp. MG1]